MIIVSYGMVKSASTFTYQVLRAALQAHCSETGGRYIALSELLDGAVDDYVGGTTDLEELDSSIQGSGFDFCQGHHLLLKTHWPASKFSNIRKNKGFVAVASYRHPVEVALSLRDAAERERDQDRKRFEKYRDLEEALAEVPYQVDCFLSWLETDCCYPIYFDDVANDALGTYGELISDLGLKASASDILAEYRDKPSTIGEFNKGVVDRRLREVDSLLLERLESEYPEIVSLIDSRRA